MKPRDLHVVTPIVNPEGYASRPALLRRFRKEMRRAGVTHWVVEAAYGRAPFQVTEAKNPHDIQLRSTTALWSKENLGNIAVAHLPKDWRHVAFIDGDVQFLNPGWVDETLARLQRFPVLQLFTHAQDLDPSHQILHGKPPATGFVYAWWNKLPHSTRYDDSRWHPGYAWAWRREELIAVGGLFELGALGSGDRHMGMGLIGKAELSFPPQVSEGYKRAVLAWQARAERAVKRNINFVPGGLVHWWHGKKPDRQYGDRWKILARHQFDPTIHLRRDPTNHGLLEVVDSAMEMAHDFTRYFRARREDSVDTE